MPGNTMGYPWISHVIKRHSQNVAGKSSANGHLNEEIIEINDFMEVFQLARFEHSSG